VGRIFAQTRPANHSAPRAKAMHIKAIDIKAIDIKAMPR
jgi:hypothetical protein